MAKKTTARKAAPKATEIKGNLADVDVTVKELDGRACVQLTMANGTYVEVSVNKWGHLLVDHARDNVFNDHRRILEGSLTPRKRSFEVFSTSGYANSYKGKPIVPLTATAAAPATPSGGVSTTASASTSAPTPSAASTESSAPGAAAPVKGKGSKAINEFKPGDNVTRENGDKGEVVGIGTDAVGAYIEVEWDDAGYESMYADDVKGAGVTSASTTEVKEEKVEEVTHTVAGLTHVPGTSMDVRLASLVRSI